MALYKDFLDKRVQRPGEDSCYERDILLHKISYRMTRWH